MLNLCQVLQLFKQFHYSFEKSNFTVCYLGSVSQFSNKHTCVHTSEIYIFNFMYLVVRVCMCAFIKRGFIEMKKNQGVPHSIDTWEVRSSNKHLGALEMYFNLKDRQHLWDIIHCGRSKALRLV